MMTDADVSDGVKGHCLDWSLMVKCGTVVDFRVYGRSSPSYGDCEVHVLGQKCPVA